MPAEGESRDPAGYNIVLFSTARHQERHAPYDHDVDGIYGRVLTWALVLGILMITCIDRARRTEETFRQQQHQRIWANEDMANTQEVKGSTTLLIRYFSEQTSEEIFRSCSDMPLCRFQINSDASSRCNAPRPGIGSLTYVREHAEIPKLQTSACRLKRSSHQITWSKCHGSSYQPSNQSNQGANHSSIGPPTPVSY